MQLRYATRWLTTASTPVSKNVAKTTRSLLTPLLAPFNQITSNVVRRSFFMASTKACQSTEASQPYTNQLIHSKSPYLLQHAHNPVNWYPWGKEAFEKAKEEQKLIFLSVGYSTCHWCHVMEKESFENPAIAELMNKDFVNIKVDREERPDVDKMYMNFIQAISGHGGWPMSVWLTPDLRPVFGGTYYPPDDRYYGRPGFGTILKSLAAQWKENPGKFAQSGEQIVSILSDSVALEGLGDIPSATECSTRCFQQLQNSYEPTFGGFSKSPKFPQPVNLQFLLRQHIKSRSNLEASSQSLEMCLHTLRQMAKGGIYDHVSKGFARYSTDEKWHIPHFEKMLYDQAQLAAVYAEAYLVTKDESFSRVVREILAYVEECLSDASGGFYSAEDADSYPSSGAKEKKEGAFYVWTYEEVQSLLGKTAAGENFTLADVVCHHFDIRPNGNVEPYQDPHDELKRQNVLIIRASREETADKFGLAGGVDALDRLLSQALAIMKQARDKRPRPHLDDKMLASWNGLMISALAKAGAILNERPYIDRAIKAARFMRAHLYDQESGRLLRSCYRASSDDGPSQNPVPIEGFLDDYAFTIGGLLDLFTVCQDDQWLQWADQLQRKQDQLFWDAGPTSGAYFTSAHGDANLLVRSKEDQDGAEPSGNSVSVSNLVRLSLLLDCAEYRDKAGRILQLFHQRLSRVPVAMPAMVSALIMYQDSPAEVVVVGPSSSETVTQLSSEAQGHVTSLLGQLLIRFDPSDPDQRKGFIVGRRPELLQMKSSPPAAYLCRHRSCSAPVESAADLRRLLDQ